VGANSEGAGKLTLKLITTTPMPGFKGDFDHFGLDLKGNRLFLAAEEHKTVKVSSDGGTDPESNQLVVADGDDSAVLLVDCTQYKIIQNH